MARRRRKSRLNPRRSRRDKTRRAQRRRAGWSYGPRDQRRLTRQWKRVERRWPKHMRSVIIMKKRRRATKLTDRMMESAAHEYNTSGRYTGWRGTIAYIKRKFNLDAGDMRPYHFVTKHFMG